MEENISIASGTAYHAYPFFDSTNEQGAYPLAHICRYPRQYLQVCRQLWRHSGVPIIPE